MPLEPNFSDQPAIDVLLASCDGEKFLAAQLDSILAQSYNHFRIIVSDDASQDKSPIILQKYAERYPEKFVIIESHPSPSQGERLGAKANFSKLLGFSSAPYIMFSDQDDVWMPQKIEKTLLEMKSLELKYGALPFLVHSDLVVVEENMKVLNHSFWDYTILNPLQMKL